MDLLQRDPRRPPLSGRLGELLFRLRTNDVETGRSRAYPRLQPLELGADPESAYAAAVETARATRGWRIVEEAPARRSFHAEARTRFLRFVDDVTVHVEETPSGGSLVRARSASRVGMWDLGTNARRIRAYFTRLAGRVEADG